ncbi:MAG: hypothetical protein MRECE_63c003 [Mycoplasmataceae bacterium CE_OT135]|nr:MAG: hypothetical protein MRECE_63c003 [Mycoplasmataceae bacterium CE_OT135]
MFWIKDWINLFLLLTFSGFALGEGSAIFFNSAFKSMFFNNSDKANEPVSILTFQFFRKKSK